MYNTRIANPSERHGWGSERHSISLHINHLIFTKLYAIEHNFISLQQITAKHIIILSLATFVKTKRKEAELTQQEFADKAGVKLPLLKIEQGKENLSMAK